MESFTHKKIREVLELFGIEGNSKVIGGWNITGHLMNAFKEARNDEKWVIWSIEHGAWWGPNHRGYVYVYDQAGEYTYDEALKIVQGANRVITNDPHEAMIKKYG